MKIYQARKGDQMFKFRKQKSTNQTLAQGNSVRKESPVIAAPAKINRPVDFSCPVSDEERELVSVAAGAILAGDNADSVFRVKSVAGIDCDKEAAAAVVAAVLSSERSDTLFRLKSIAEIK